MNDAGKIEAAELAYAVCIGLRPDYALGYAGRARAISRRLASELNPKVAKQLVAQALAAYDRALQLDPTSALVYRERARLCYKQGEYERAMEDANQAFRLAPHGVAHIRADICALRSSIALKRADMDQALAQIDEAIRLEPRGWGFRRDRGEIHAMSSRWPQAVADFASATQLEPEDALGWCYYAMAQLGAGNVSAYRTACAQMQRRFSKAKDASDVACLLYACLPTPRSVAGTELLRWARAAIPKNHRLMGAVLYRAGQSSEAIAHFEQAAKERQQSAWDFLFLALAHAQLGHPDVARQYVSKADACLEQVEHDTTGKVTRIRPPWTEQVQVRLLRHEAESALKQGPKTSGKR